MREIVFQAMHEGAYPAENKMMSFSRRANPTKTIIISRNAIFLNFIHIYRLRSWIAGKNNWLRCLSVCKARRERGGGGRARSTSLICKRHSAF